MIAEGILDILKGLLRHGRPLDHFHFFVKHGVDETFYCLKVVPALQVFFTCLKIGFLQVS